MRLYLFGGGAPLLEDLAIDPSSATVGVGAEFQLEAYADLSSDPSMNVTGEVSWSSSDESVATVSASGLVLGLADGFATITARLGSRTAHAHLEISGEATELLYFRHTMISDARDFSVTLPVELASDGYMVKLQQVKGAAAPELEPVDEQSSDRTTTTFRVVATAPLSAGDQIDVLVMR